MFSDITGAVQTAANIGSSIANYKLQKENLQYQKNLQNQIFEREDNSVQRRVADLEAAGLNKNLAAGSSAGAGSVVSTTAPQVQAPDLGAMLDFKAAQTQIDSTKAQTKNAQVENNILTKQAGDANINNMLNKVNFYNQLGLPISFDPYNFQIRLDNNYIKENMVYDKNGFGAIPLNNSPMSTLFKLGVTNAENNAALLQGDTDWQQALKTWKFLGPIVQGLFGLGAAKIR